jgi:Ca2+-binding RTX toxin-like protein
MANVPGTSGNDILIGGNGVADVLNSDWLGGDDTMAGGTGNDTYHVNSAGDQVLENVGAGTDNVVSRLGSYTLTDNVENLTLDNTPTQLVLLPGGEFAFVPSAINGTGNELDNVIVGNSRDNTLSGLDGDDSLYGQDGDDLVQGGNGDDFLNGGTGDDTLQGGFGNDLIFGGTGDDSMSGSLGNDIFYVDSAGDTVSEGALLGGVDEVRSTVSETLDANVENLWLLGTALNGTGNASANRIQGNSSNNTLSGQGGNDTLIAGAGNDTVLGGDGDDELQGEAGLDALTGGAGLDRFVFEHSGAANADTITDFSHADDTIVLADVLDAAMAGAISPGLRGLSFAGGNTPGNTLNVGRYFEGVGATGNAGELSGIFVDTLAGEIYYNPTSGTAGDSVLLGRVSFAVAASLDATDFVLGA